MQVPKDGKKTIYSLNITDKISAGNFLNQPFLTYVYVKRIEARSSETNPNTTDICVIWICINLTSLDMSHTLSSNETAMSDIQKELCETTPTKFNYAYPGRNVLRKSIPNF